MENKTEIEMKPANDNVVISKHSLIAAIGYCGIRQSPYDFPLNLERALDAVSKRIDSANVFKSTEKKSVGSYLSTTPAEAKKLIHDLVFNTPEIAIWNVTKREQDNGITDPNDEKRTVKYAFCSSDGTSSRQDVDFIDLDALVMNVYGMAI